MAMATKGTHNTTRHTSSSSPIVAGFVYFAVVFGIAFVLGAIRVIFLVPRVGEVAAVLTETPVVLTVSWRTMTSIVHSTTHLRNVKDRLVMGLAAFCFLMVAELVLSVAAFDKTPQQFLEELTSSPSHVIGLLGQIAYGMFPLAELWASSNRSSKRTKAV